MLVLDRIDRRRPRIAAGKTGAVQRAVDLEADVEAGRHRLAVEFAQRPGLVEREILLQRRQRLRRPFVVLLPAPSARHRRRRRRIAPAAAAMTDNRFNIAICALELRQIASRLVA